MTCQLTNNDERVREVMRLSEEAAQFHGQMAGHLQFPESFIRDWVAIGLHRLHGLGVTVETNRADYRQYVVSPDKWAAFNQIDLKNFRLDMIVWKEKSDLPFTIIEFKRTIDISEDLERASRIVSVSGRPGLDGYIVVCIMFNPRETFLQRSAQFDAVTAGLRDGEVMMREPIQVDNGPRIGIDWVGVLATKVRRSHWQD